MTRIVTITVVVATIVIIIIIINSSICLCGFPIANVYLLYTFTALIFKYPSTHTFFVLTRSSLFTFSANSILKPSSLYKILNKKNYAERSIFMLIHFSYGQIHSNFANIHQRAFLIFAYKVKLTFNILHSLSP